MSEAIEETLAAMEETMDILEEATCLLTPGQHAARYIAVGALAGGIGGVAAYFIGKRFLEAKYDEIAKAEIEEAKRFYSALNKKDEFSTPEKAVSALIDVDAVGEAASALLSYQGDEDDENDEDVPAENTVNVFLQSAADENFDLEAEMKNRSPEVAYVISEEEYMANEPEHEQMAITYYAGDGVLANDKDLEIPAINHVVGPDYLKFGHGSGDSRVVFIRNERINTDFEILKSDGKYAHEVLGLEHSDGGPRDRRQMNQPRKFRGGDE